MKKFLNLILLIIFFLENIYSQNSFDELMDRFIQIPEKSDTTIYNDIISSGIEIIPYLIEIIDINKQFLDFCNINSNNLYLNYFGVYAAKLIEDIIANKNDETFNFNKIYNKKENTYLLNYEDMINIKFLYKKWWENINDTKIFCKRGALSGSNYCWKYCEN